MGSVDSGGQMTGNQCKTMHCIEYYLDMQLAIENAMPANNCKASAIKNAILVIAF